MARSHRSNLQIPNTKLFKIEIALIRITNDNNSHLKAPFRALLVSLQSISQSNIFAIANLDSGRISQTLRLGEGETFKKETLSLEHEENEHNTKQFLNLND